MDRTHVLFFAIMGAYFLMSVGIFYSLEYGLIPPPTFVEETEVVIADINATILAERLGAAQTFMHERMIDPETKRVNLYYLSSPSKAFENFDSTNSEAASYYLLWTVQADDEQHFMDQWNFIERHMIHPTAGYLQWRIERDGRATEEGSHIASDADLRALFALKAASLKWGERYERHFNRLATSLEEIGITPNGGLAPYGGVNEDGSIWRAEDIWISYADFRALDTLRAFDGTRWNSVYARMKEITLDSQTAIGLYYTEYTPDDAHHLELDGGVHSINTIWIMIHAAESGDAELRSSARTALTFYKEKYMQDGQLYDAYATTGDAISPSDSPWVYALVARAAIALDDRAFATQLLEHLLDYQDMDRSSPFYGGFVEGGATTPRASQFTNQEAILTLQAYELQRGSA